MNFLNTEVPVEDGFQAVRLISERPLRAPKQWYWVDDTLNANLAFKWLRQGAHLIWAGDYHNARNLLSALGRRLDPKHKPGQSKESLKQQFHAHRLAQAQRAELLNALWIPFEGDGEVMLRRCPQAKVWLEAALYPQVWTDFEGLNLVPLRMLQGLNGAHQWQTKGMEIPELGAPPNNRIYPRYGVYSPVRGEYLKLIDQAALPQGCRAVLDLGTGTGVVAAILAKRMKAQNQNGRIVATDVDPRSVQCARDNLAQLGLSAIVEVKQCDGVEGLEAGSFDLVVCNPPWLPVKAMVPIEQALYDEHHAFLLKVLRETGKVLRPQGQLWLVMSDLAEHLELRPVGQLQQWFEQEGWKVLAHSSTQPVHSKARDASDPLHAARSREITSLWQLACQKT